ncbi:hypothetical protein [Sphingomonas qomolangmaensis]|uniref:Uncharacterized protein n=1 Tax=Sphingomonas qomolangmaensis TaxID=2918765 RepID=A0ABY5LDK8_9SPHN|nr:hypothetical protein [Sphingomonas qomolangmaensis]UUL83804.1 hypothetical protein NMP03_06310 [Sphingomonas qomolangmaensis]
MALPVFPLKNFDESRSEYVVALLVSRVRASVEDPGVSPGFYLIEKPISDAIDAAKLASGFATGVHRGAKARYAVMQEDFRRDYAALRQLFSAELGAAFGHALAAGFDEWLRRPIVELNPTGLTPDSIAAARRMIEMFEAERFLQMIGLVDSIVKAGALLETLALGADELFELLAGEGTSWARTVLLETDPQRQGEMLGRPVGVALFEVVRMIVEPPALDAMHMLGVLAPTAAEKQAIGI